MTTRIHAIDLGNRLSTPAVLRIGWDPGCSDDAEMWPHIQCNLSSSLTAVTVITKPTGTVFTVVVYTGSVARSWRLLAHPAVLHREITPNYRQRAASRLVVQCHDLRAGQHAQFAKLRQQRNRRGNGVGGVGFVDGQYIVGSCSGQVSACDNCSKLISPLLRLRWPSRRPPVLVVEIDFDHGRFDQY